jgi:hypothetical protein
MAFPFGRLSEDCKIVPIAKYAAANSDRNSEVIDTKGYGGCCILVTHATIASGSVMNIYLTSSDAVTDENTLSSGANVATSNQVVADTDDDTVKYFDFIPEKRYYQMVFDKDASNSAAESAVAILYNAKDRPVTQSTGNTTVGEGVGAVTGEMMGLATQGAK